MMCISCTGNDLPWEPEESIAEYTTVAGNTASLCETCLSMWLRNSAADIRLAPVQLRFLGALAT